MYIGILDVTLASMQAYYTALPRYGIGVGRPGGEEESEQAHAHMCNASALSALTP